MQAAIDQMPIRLLYDLHRAARTHGDAVRAYVVGLGDEVRSPAHHLEARTAGQRRDLNVNRLIEERAQAFARAQNPERRVEDMLALGRQKQIRAAYADAAAALATTGKVEDRVLAEDIARFVADMPPPVSRRLERARQIMIADRAHGSAVSRSRNTVGDVAEGQTQIERKPRDRDR